MHPDTEQSLDHAPSPEELIKLYQAAGENDPTSPYYKRELVRPPLHLWRAVLHILLTLLTATALGLWVSMLSQSLAAAALSGAAYLLLAAVLFAKRIAIWLVKVYQRLAPARVRKRCRFEPSCSQYMILSLQKYGFCKGLKKGVCRCFRCKPPNGGTDFP